MRSIALKTLLTLTFMVASTASYSEGKTTMTDDQQAVLTAVQTMTDAFHKGDIEGVMASYEPGAVVMFEPGQAVRETQDIAAMFQGAFTLKPHFDYQNGHEVVVSGDTAVHFAPWLMTATDPSGQAIEQRGLSVAVLKRQEDGRWLMVIDNPHGQRLLD